MRIRTGEIVVVAHDRHPPIRPIAGGSDGEGRRAVARVSIHCFDFLAWTTVGSGQAGSMPGTSAVTGDLVDTDRAARRRDMASQLREG